MLLGSGECKRRLPNARRRLGYENPNHAQLRDRHRSSMVDEQLSQWVNGRRAQPPCEIAPNAGYERTSAC